MEKNIVSKGKSVQEALETALDLLGVTSNEVNIEVLDPGEKGFLGFKAKPAVVRVTPLQREKSEKRYIEDRENLKFLESISANNPEENNPVENLQGTAWVSNGKIYCKDAENKYPLINPAKGVTLYKNDILVRYTDIISESDTIRAEVINEVIRPSWEIVLNSDKSEALLKVKPGMKLIRKLKDTSPNTNLHLEITEEKIPLFIEVEKILEEATKRGIVHGLDFSGIHLACQSETEGTFVLAKATMPVQGKHGFFQVLQSVEIKTFIKERFDGSVDFREIKEFPSVDFGQVIGVVIPPKAGTPGITVTGEPLQPAEAHPLILKPGKGVLVAEGNKVVATVSGHPEVKIKGQLASISVIPKLVIQNDVTLETGNVHYIGVVEITGSVQDGMQVEATGNILVKENTNKSKIISEGSIVVQKNVIGSILTAGSSGLLKTNLARLLIDLINSLRRMADAINQLSQISAFKETSLKLTGLGPLIKILTESKFKDFPELTTSVIKKIRTGSSELETEWLEFAESLNKNFVAIPISGLKSAEDILSIIQQAEALLASVKGNETNSADVRAENVQNSELYSSGDIVISGKGVYNSKLYAKRNISIKGFLRGGEIYAEADIDLNEVGERSGSSVLVATSSKGKIKIKTASEDTTIQVGDQSQKLLKKSTNIMAGLDEHGQLVISQGVV
ncbi:FapA family protein [Bacillus massiliglaciei]|uniref:FapA family protein n=1 Tax=Bacillus massiliglaciei TaxID=1816693 RepID=UPI000DA5EDAE|nr:FapA family protein [Bacillus massiliglaciei]